MLRRSISTY